ncbi:cobalt-zinc-cadmium efflux system protein [Pontibacter ummariensis]|uniref:Cobalt-zinc-cadmium efflux system protein n=1 Tax=Pontibacter ummariensis TaxID=1610492 RepID=A0A239KG61_9BACT|nr:cation diffusion facilitator family transporter [Pontibacter ummariensis]PRY06406.1 cobalt-zinc-cadmium efflux system protein [Pontibacter ummariensis]SNT16692.1 cobalt-zinc-cadmium efflux system protein [Pontibacter ummariensis]
MGHHHHHHHGPHHYNPATGNIRFAFFLNLGFALLELIGGFFVNSMAIMSDALHDFGDAFALGLTYFLQRKSGQEGNENYTYGYKRYSVAGALLTSLILLAGAGFVITEAAQRLLQPTMPEPLGMLLFAVLGILVNGEAFFRLKGGGNLNQRAVSLHMLEDLLGWLAVLVASIVLLFFELPWLDPLLSLAISVYMLLHAVKSAWAALKVFLQANPLSNRLEEVKGKLLALDTVRDVHQLRVWSLDGEHHVLSAHVVVSEAQKPAAVAALKSGIRNALKPFAITDVTLELELEAERCAHRV